MKSFSREHFTVQIHNSHVSPTKQASLAHHKPESTRTARDDANSPLEGKAGQRSLEMHSTSTSNGYARWVRLFIRVFNHDSVVCTGEGSRMAILVLKSTLCDTRGTLVLFVELTRACNGTDGVCGLVERERCKAAVDLRGRSEELGGVHNCGQWVVFRGRVG